MSCRAVLYLAFEDKEDEVRQHFDKMGSRDLPLALRFGRRPEQLIEKMHRFIDKNTVALVVLDPLFRAIDLQKADYPEVMAKMEPLEKVDRDTGAHIMVTHHLGKRNGRAATKS